MNKIHSPEWLKRTAKVVRIGAEWWVRAGYKGDTDDYGPYKTKREAEEDKRGLLHTWSCWAEMRNMPPPQLNRPPPRRKLLKKFLKQNSADDLKPDNPEF